MKDYFTKDGSWKKVMVINIHLRIEFKIFSFHWMMKQRTNSPVNPHLFWTVLLVGKLITPALGHNLYEPHG